MLRVGLLFGCYDVVLWVELLALLCGFDLVLGVAIGWICWFGLLVLDWCLGWFGCIVSEVFFVGYLVRGLLVLRLFVGCIVDFCGCVGWFVLLRLVVVVD